MTNDLTMLPKPELHEAAKVMVNRGYSLRKIESVLGIDHSAAAIYAQQQTPEELKEFSTIFDNYLTECEQKGIRMVADRIIELIPKERRIDQLVRAGEYFKGKSQNIIQQNMKIDFIDWDKDDSKMV